MKLLIVGLGSMGKRRARLTKGIDAAIQIIGVDTAESRRAEAQSLGLADAAYPTIQDAVTATTRPSGWVWRTQPMPPSARPSPPSTPTPRWSAPRRFPMRRSSANCWTMICLSLPS